MDETDVKAWVPASEAWKDFAKAHPEFGVRPTENSWIHFQRTHAPTLIKADVIRRIAFRGRMLADTRRFEHATFNLLTTGNVDGLPRRVAVVGLPGQNRERQP
jgi:hypothetical protein